MLKCANAHSQGNVNCIYCLKELVVEQGKIINNMYDRLDYIYDVMPCISNKPDEVRKFLQDVEAKFPPCGKGSTYLMIEDELKAASPYGGKS